MRNIERPREKEQRERDKYRERERERERELIFVASGMQVQKNPSVCPSVLRTPAASL